MKSEALELVKEIVEAPSCFPALREKGEALLAACGSADETSQPRPASQVRRAIRARMR